MSKPGTNGVNVTVRPDGIAVVTLDHFPVNSLSGAVSNGLTRAVQRIDNDASIKGVVVHGSGRCFCAGADIGQFSGGGEARVELGRKKSGMFGFENCKQPVVAAIHGYALGGGLELSLDCHYRIIDATAQVGLPEVNIGLLPGGQGTQRLPRLIGCDAALTFMTTGEHVAAGLAKEWGLVDLVAPPGADLVAAAVEFCKRKIAGGGPHVGIASRPTPTPIDFAPWRQAMAKKRPGEPAPQAIISCVEAACRGPTFRDGVIAEQRLFRPLIISPESQALRHMFFAERAGTKVDGPAGKLPPRPINKVGIVGAGLMGGGIAMCCANAGIKVKILDVNKKGLAKGLATIKSNYDRSVKRGTMSAGEAAAAQSLIQGTLEYGALHDRDLVVEAVFEDMSVKLKIFEALDAAVQPGAFLCSNTSALNIDRIASATSRPELVMGTHFFSPANKMKLLENVRGAKTSDVTIASMMAWGKKIGKWAILVGNCPGFVGNRMVGFYGGQARKMLQEGCSVKSIDDAAEQFGMRMGPLAMSDLVGLDLGLGAAKKAGRYKPSRVIQHALVEAGRKGQKTKAGFYDYEGRTRVPSAAVRDIILTVAENNGVAQRMVGDEEKVNRLFFPMVNEGFKILAEGMAQRPADIDVCYVHGYNFPRTKGGPMFWADSVGLDKVQAQLKAIGIKPAPLLDEVVASGMSLDKFWKKRAATAKKNRARL